MPPPRRRLRSLLPLVSVISASLLFLFLTLSFLAPSPPESGPFSIPHRQISSNLGQAEANGDGNFEFLVPNDGGRSDRDIWSSRNADVFYGCSNASNKFASSGAVTVRNRYLAIVTSGGLNQQRTGITDAVVAARILNATLVVPKLDQKSFWKDSSDFAEIFDVDWFISFLSKDINIVKQFPLKEGKTWVPQRMRVPRKCSERCYQNRVLPVLLKRHMVQLSKFDYRLANKLNNDLQKLRCRANYHALKFTDSISEMGKKLVHRMKMKSKHFIALHLRFEPDMLAFSGCDYGGGVKEKIELGAIRRRWKTLHIRNPEKQRRQGRCPLTPEEVGLMLRALGYGQNVHIYVASGEVYGGEETLQPLKKLFPNFYSKDTIASREELDQFSAFSSRMAALDFIVCDASDVFVTNNNGNMAKILAGRRRYFGHKPTIRPNAKKLYRLFMSRHNMTWESFASKVRKFQRGFMGEPNEVRPGRGEFHENPSACICQDSKTKANPWPIKHDKVDDVTLQDDVQNDQVDDDDDDPEWHDTDGEDQRISEEKDGEDGTSADFDSATNEELDDVLSD